jgi:hypothetical protein
MSFMEWFDRSVIGVLESRAAKRSAAQATANAHAPPKEKMAKPAPVPVGMFAHDARPAEASRHEGGQTGQTDQTESLATVMAPLVEALTTATNTQATTLANTLGPALVQAMQNTRLSETETGEASPQFANSFAPKKDFKPFNRGSSERRAASTSIGNRDSEVKKAASRAGEMDPCFHCKLPHLLIDCPWFTNLPYSDRVKEIDQVNRCHGCMYTLEPGHKCKAKVCRHCKGPHHPLLCAQAPIPKTCMEHSVERVAKTLDKADFYLNVARQNAPTTEVNAEYACDFLTPEQIDDAISLAVSYAHREAL